MRESILQCVDTYDCYLTVLLVEVLVTVILVVAVMVWTERGGGR